MPSFPRDRLREECRSTTGRKVERCRMEDPTVAEPVGSIEQTGVNVTGLQHADRSIPPYCEIRDVAIENPFYTYCANHPHRRPDRDPIPIGPVMRHGGWEQERRVEAGKPDVLVSRENPRYVWKPSPDSEEIRQHLLSLLASILEHIGQGSISYRHRSRGDDHPATR